MTKSGPEPWKTNAAWSIYRAELKLYSRASAIDETKLVAAIIYYGIRPHRPDEYAEAIKMDELLQTTPKQACEAEQVQQMRPNLAIETCADWAHQIANLSQFERFLKYMDKKLEFSAQGTVASRKVAVLRFTRNASEDLEGALRRFDKLHQEAVQGGSKIEDDTLCHALYGGLGLNADQQLAVQKILRFRRNPRKRVHRTEEDHQEDISAAAYMGEP